MSDETSLLRPLHGVRVLDVSGLGPGPFCSMLLSDYGAEVVAVERPDPEPFDPSPFFSRGKRSVVVDIRAPGGTDVVRRLARTADVFIESYRPGTMERRGLGPSVLMSQNPRLVYARITGFGQSGPYAHRAGHDVNFIAAAGVLGAIGTERPVPPQNILGDFAAGSLTAAVGILLALLERGRSGKGQIVDAAMVDGAAMLLAGQLAEYAAGTWRGLGHSMLSGNAPFYGVYECADGRWFAVGAIEERFYQNLVTALGLDAEELRGLGDRHDQACWPALRQRIATAFAEKPREYWVRAFSQVDGCGTPVLGLDELAADPHLSERGTFVNRDGVLEARPAPRLSRDPWRLAPRVPERGADTGAVLAEAGFAEHELMALVTAGVLLGPVPGTRHDAPGPAGEAALPRYNKQC